MASNLAPTRVVPIWQRLPEITLYPMQSGALSMIALLSVLRLISLVPMLGIMKGTVHFLISVSLYRYAVQVLIDTTEGKLKAPEYTFGVDNSEAVDQIKLQVLLIAAMAVAFIFGGLLIGIVVMVVVAVATPAATMSLAIERSLLHAINPINWVRIGAGFGPAYLLLAALCLFYGITQTVAVAFMPGWLPSIISVPVIWFLTHYAIVVSFHAMGYLILQYREKIGYRVVAPEPLPKLRHHLDPDHDLLERLGAMAARGETKPAIVELRQHLDSRGGTQKSHDLYRQLLTAESDQAELARHARQYVSVLMAQGADAKAVQMLQACLEGEADYCPSEISELRPLAEAASKFGKHELAVRVLVNGIKRFAKSHENPANALLAARLLSEKLNADDKARQLLLAIKTRYPEHPQITDIDQYLGYLDSIKK